MGSHRMLRMRATSSGTYWGAITLEPGKVKGELSCGPATV
jgi:hypothetical protein